jgi:hypothetical protein
LTTTTALSQVSAAIALRPSSFHVREECQTVLWGSYQGPTGYAIKVVSGVPSLKITLANWLGIAVTSNTTMKQYSSEYFQEAGARGGKASRAKLTPEQRKESARAAAKARWAKEKAKKAGADK